VKWVTTESYLHCWRLKHRHDFSRINHGGLLHSRKKSSETRPTGTKRQLSPKWVIAAALSGKEPTPIRPSTTLSDSRCRKGATIFEMFFAPPRRKTAKAFVGCGATYQVSRHRHANRSIVDRGDALRCDASVTLCDVLKTRRIAS